MGAAAFAAAVAAGVWAALHRRKKPPAPLGAAHPKPGARGAQAGAGPGAVDSLGLERARTGSSCGLKDLKLDLPSNGQPASNLAQCGVAPLTGAVYPVVPSSPQQDAAAAAAWAAGEDGFGTPFNLGGARAYASGPQPSGRAWRPSSLLLHSQRPGLQGQRPARLPSLSSPLPSTVAESTGSDGLGTGARHSFETTAGASQEAAWQHSGGAKQPQQQQHGVRQHSGGGGGPQQFSSEEASPGTPFAVGAVRVRPSRQESSWEKSADVLLGRGTPRAGAGAGGGNLSGGSSGRQASSRPGLFSALSLRACTVRLVSTVARSHRCCACWFTLWLPSRATCPGGLPAPRRC